MDSDDDAFELPVRKRTRLSSKKVVKKKRVDKPQVESISDGPVVKRRKNDVNQNTKLSDRKLNVGFKCCPHLLHELFRSLDLEQRKWVEELGFGLLLGMPNCRLPKGLTVWLINRVSWKKKALVVGGRTIIIRNHVKNLLGIPDGSIPVPLPRSKRGKCKIIPMSVTETEPKDEKSARGLSYKTMFDSLKANHDPVLFKRDFMLYVLCIYFAPSSGHFINKSYYPVVSNVEMIKSMNWCEHVADALIEGVREYRQSTAWNVNVHGCVHILVLIYVDLVKSAIISVPQGIPRANYVDSEMLELLDYHDLKFTTHDGPEYGKLQMVDSNYGNEDNPSSKKAQNNCAKLRSKKPCSSNAESIDAEEVFRVGMRKIDLQYAEARDRAYEECFEILRSKFRKIDLLRSSSISELHAKCYLPKKSSSLKPRTGPTISAGRSAYTQNSFQAPGDDPNHTSVFSTPNRSRPDAHVPNQHPNELSFQFHIAKADKKTVRKGANADTSTASTVSGDKENTDTSTNGHASAKSVDLQSNCRQLSNVLLFSAEQRNNRYKPRSVSVLRSPASWLLTGLSFADICHFSEQEDFTETVDPEIVSTPCNQGVHLVNSKSNPAMPEMNPYDNGNHVNKSAEGSEDWQIVGNTSADVTSEEALAEMQEKDPLGFDIFTEVNAIGKECTQQVGDVQPEDVSGVNVRVNPVENTCSTNSFPVQCAQHEQSAVQLETPDADNTQGPVQRQSISAGNNISSQVLTIEEYSPDGHLCSADSLEGAAAVIEGDRGLPTAQISREPPVISSSIVISTQALAVTQEEECHGIQSRAGYIPDCPEFCTRHDVSNVDTVLSPIRGGELFSGAGSINATVRGRKKRLVGRKEETMHGLAQLKKNTVNIKSGANATYTDHVEKSEFFSSVRRDHTDPARNCGGKTKILIRGVHLTEEEFVHTLRPNGEVDLNFMWLISVAIMLDWRSSTRTILNQSIIKELMKPHDSCDHNKIAVKLKSLRLELIDQIYLPVRNNQHWILIIISISGCLVEIYDSLRSSDRVNDWHTKLWEVMGSNLQIAYSRAASLDVPLHDQFKRHDAQIQTQDFIHDCGLEVIRLLACHNGKELIGFGNKSMRVFRKEVAHVLLYHQFNDLNPKRKSANQAFD